MIKHSVVNISDLRRIVNDLLEHAETVNGPELRLDQDYYWSLDSDVLYDMTRQPPGADRVGSLGDSWEFLRNMKEQDIRTEGPSLMLVHAAPLLHYIGEKVGS
ncbi:MAG TPA: hypothetical protein VIM98_10090 [Dyella sp.]|uniref:hypothetical protein n=1 Tax=Dyella sp. TaxID=1869338 RepID=UPI002F9258BB